MRIKKSSFRLFDEGTRRMYEIIWVNISPNHRQNIFKVNVMIKEHNGVNKPYFDTEAGSALELNAVIIPNAKESEDILTTAIAFNKSKK